MPLHLKHQRPTLGRIAWQALQMIEGIIQGQPRHQQAHEARGRAFFKLGRFKAAAKSCRIAEDLAGAKSNYQTPLRMLQDDIALTAAMHSSFDGFDGRLLQVSALLCSHLGITG